MIEEKKKPSDEVILQILALQKENAKKKVLPWWVQLIGYSLILLSIFLSTKLLYNTIRHPDSDFFSSIAFLFSK